MSEDIPGRFEQDVPQHTRTGKGPQMRIRRNVPSSRGPREQNASPVSGATLRASPFCLGHS